MSVDEIGQRLGSRHHHQHGQYHGGHHHRQAVDHAHGGNNGVEREHRIQHQYLGDDHAKTGINGAGFFLVHLAFESLVQFGGGLEQQENTPAHQDQIPARKAQLTQGEQRRGQRNQPGHHTQQCQTHQQRQRQADNPRLVTLMRRQLLDQNGNKHQVVDTQHDFKNNQCQQARPNRRIHQEFHDLPLNRM